PAPRRTPPERRRRRPPGRRPGDEARGRGPHTGRRRTGRRPASRAGRDRTDRCRTTSSTPRPAAPRPAAPRAPAPRRRTARVGAPHERVHADHRTLADPDRVLLEAAEDIAVEEVARERGAVGVAVPVAARGTLRVRVVELLDQVRDPRQLVLDGADRQPRETL